MVNGRSEPIAHIISVFIEDVPTTADYAKKRYHNLFGRNPLLPGLGDEASFDNANETINIRKGVVTLRVKVTDDDRDQVRHTDTLSRQDKIAKLVAARMR